MRALSVRGILCIFSSWSIPRKSRAEAGATKIGGLARPVLNVTMFRSRGLASSHRLRISNRLSLFIFRWKPPPERTGISGAAPKKLRCMNMPRR
jgi:hypothetical protein